MSYLKFKAYACGLGFLKTSPVVLASTNAGHYSKKDQWIRPMAKLLPFDVVGTFELANTREGALWKL